MVSIKQLEAFYWVAKLNSFAAAAEKLNMAQSTISKRIQELEADLRLELFNRDLRTGRLTLKGAEILGMAEQILLLRENLRTTAGSESVVTGTFRLGVTELVALTWLPKLMERIQQIYPLVTLAPEVDLVSTLYKKLADHSVDLVIGPKKDRDRDFVSTELTSVEQAFMCSPAFRPDTGPLPLQELEHLPLLMKPDRSGLQMLLRNLLQENGVQLRSIISCNSMIALASLAASGLGITCLPKFYFQREIELGLLRVVETTPAMPTLQYVAAHRRDTIGDLAPRIASIAADVCDFQVAHPGI